MKILKALFTIIFISLLGLISCKHKGDLGQANNPKGSTPTSDVEIPRLDYTMWTDNTELFVEFPALVVGKTSRFAAHFTILNKHQPVREGAVTVSLIKDGKGIRNTVDSPSSPGIFSPVIQPKEAGVYQLVFDIKTPNYTDNIVIRNVQVFANINEAIETLGISEDDGSISFLKEQAWKIDFQTALVINSEIYEIINTSGVWKPSAGSTKSLVANVNGVVNFAVNNLTEGAKVKRSQLLINLSSKGMSSNNLNTEIANAKANYEQVKSEFERKRELFESKIVPKSEFEKIGRNFLVAKSNYETLSSGVSELGKEIRAPFDGYIKSISVSNGDYVEQGKQLVSIGTQQSLVLETQVAPNYGLTRDNIKEIWYLTKDGEWSAISASGGSVLSISKDVELEKPFISVYAEVNEKIYMPKGSVTEVQIAMGNGNLTATIPEKALLEDYGSFSVIVQLSGESFERRPVKIGKRNGENVEILQGLDLGEVVVTIGAYQVKMASMSGSTPAHGHEH